MRFMPFVWFVFLPAALLVPPVVHARGCGAVHARGCGSDYYLLSADGKVVWQYATRCGLEEPLTFIDPEVEQVYRVREGLLTALPFGQQKPAWAVRAPAIDADHTRGAVDWYTGPGVVALVTGKAIHGFDARTGEAAYTFAHDGLVGLRVGGELTVAGAAAFGGGPYRYLTRPDRPLSVAKFDVRRGKVVWERDLPAPAGATVRTVLSGVAEVEKGEERSLVFFRPETGEPLTKLPTGPAQAKQVWVDGDVVYHLSAENAPTLTAFDGGTQKAIWSLPGLPPATRLVGGPRSGRLLCDAGKELLVVDARRGRIQVRVAAPTAVAETEAGLLVVDRGALRLVDPGTGEEKWKGDRLANPDDPLLFAAPPAAMADRGKFVVAGLKSGLVEARSFADGAAAWSWAARARGDQQSITVRACRSGWLVQVDWVILD